MRSWSNGSQTTKWKGSSVGWGKSPISNVHVTLKAELKEACYEFELFSKNVKMLTFGTQHMETILNDEKSPSNIMGLKFSKGCHGNTSTIVLVNALSNSDLPSEIKEDQQVHREKKRRWICHFYRRPRHIRSFCYPLHGFSDFTKSVFRNNVWKKVKIEWRPKQRDERCNVALNLVHSMRATAWYFNSGCSCHMIGNAAFFTKYNKWSARHVMFGDGVKEKIIEKGSIN